MQVAENNTSPIAGSLLIVDDNEQTRDLLTGWLEGNGYATTTTGNGKQALELATTQNFDLILLDIEISDMDGLDVLKALRQSKTPTELPVLVPAPIIRAQKCSLGANDFVTNLWIFPWF
jgi:CheY-like chemotaxis protein